MIKETDGRIRSLSPWLELTARAYQKRLRVKNFSALGKRTFGELVYYAILGEDVFFTYDKDTDAPALAYANVARSDEMNVLHAEDFDWVEYKGFDGRVYDANLIERDKSLRCMAFTHPPVNNKALLLAARADSLDSKIDEDIDRLAFPETYVSGTSPQVKIVAREQSNLKEYRKFDANDDSRSSGAIKPDVDNLPQWDISQLLNLRKLTAFSFEEETNVPVQDLSSLDTLGIATESMIAHRESFISRLYILKQELQAVFEPLDIKPIVQTTVQFNDGTDSGDTTTLTVGSTSDGDSSGSVVSDELADSVVQSSQADESTPTVEQAEQLSVGLVFESAFPYTPQDIASIGDAFGKGLNQNVVDSYNLS